MGISIEDRLAIQELYARQAWALDTGDVDSYVDVFAADATLDLAAQHQGHAAIRAFAEAFRARDVGLPGGQHHVDQLVFEPAADGVRCQTRAYVTRSYRLPGRGRNNTLMIWQGYYADTLVRTADGWRFERQVGRAWEGGVLERVSAARTTPLVSG
jgi:hypothetical protein